MKNIKIKEIMKKYLFNRKTFCIVVYVVATTVFRLGFEANITVHSMPCRFEVKPIKINFCQKSSTFHLSIMQVFFPLFQPQFNPLILWASCYSKNINLTTWVVFKDRVMWAWTFVVGGTLWIFHIPLIFISLSDFRHFPYHFTMFSCSISPKNLRYPPNPLKEKTKREKIFTQRLPLNNVAMINNLCLSWNNENALLLLSRICIKTSLTLQVEPAIPISWHKARLLLGFNLN